METPFPAYTGDEPYVFVCYAHDDAEVVYPELEWLRERGANLWYDEGISAGRNWRSVIGESIINSGRFLFYVSEGSLASDHCNREVNLALDEGKEVVPVYLEDVELTADLKVGLNRVQALHRHRDASYQQHLLDAVVHASAAQVTRVTEPTKKRSWRVYCGFALLSCAALMSAWWVTSHITRGKTASDIYEMRDAASIAVVPFRASLSDPKAVALAEGMVDELINELSGPRLERVRRGYPIIADGLRVAPATSTHHEPLTTQDSMPIAKTLNVTYLVEGSVQADDNQLRVFVRLIHAADNAQIWSKTYDSGVENLLAMQAEIARNAAHLATVTIPNDIWYRSIKPRFTNTAAHGYFVRAHRNTTLQHLGHYIDPLIVANDYEKALELNPAFMPTYQPLIETYLNSMWTSTKPITPVMSIDDLIERWASYIETDTNAPWLAWANGRRSLLQFRYLDADRYVHHSLSIRPNELSMLTTLGYLALHRGNLEGARSSFQRAINAGSMSTAIASYAQTLLASRRYVETVDLIERQLDFIPGDYGKCRLLLLQSNAHWALNEANRAAEVVDLAWRRCGLQHSEIFAAGLAVTNRLERSAAILPALEEGVTAGRLDPVDLIEAHVALNDFDGAFQWINQGIDDSHFGVVTWVHFARHNSPFQDDPRWQEIIGRLPDVPGV